MPPCFDLFAVLIMFFYLLFKFPFAELPSFEASITNTKGPRDQGWSMAMYAGFCQCAGENLAVPWFAQGDLRLSWLMIIDDYTINHYKKSGMITIQYRKSIDDYSWWSQSIGNPIDKPEFKYSGMTEEIEHCTFADFAMIRKRAILESSCQQAEYMKASRTSSPTRTSVQIWVAPLPITDLHWDDEALYD